MQPKPAMSASKYMSGKSADRGSNFDCIRDDPHFKALVGD